MDTTFMRRPSLERTCLSDRQFNRYPPGRWKDDIWNKETLEAIMEWKTKKIFFQKIDGGNLESTLPDAINWRNQKKSARITFEAYHYQYPSTSRATLSYIFYLTPEKVIREVDYQRHSPFKSAQRYRHNRQSNLKSANCPYFQIMQVAQDLGLRLNTSKTKSTPETKFSFIQI